MFARKTFLIATQIILTDNGYYAELPDGYRLIFDAEDNYIGRYNPNLDSVI